MTKVFATRNLVLLQILRQKSSSKGNAVDNNKIDGARTSDTSSGLYKGVRTRSLAFAY